MLAGALVRPGMREVLPLPPEPIRKEDGMRKNDCERNAAKRFVSDLRREHPHLPVLLVADGLYSNGPFINLLKEKGIRFAIMAKKADHKALFEAVDRAERTAPKSVTRFRRKGSDGLRHGFRFINGVPLNGTHSDLQVSFMQLFPLTLGFSGSVFAAPSAGRAGAAGARAALRAA